MMKDMGWTPYGCTSCEDMWSAWGRRRPQVPAPERVPPTCWGRCWHHRLAPPPQWCHPLGRSRSPPAAQLRSDPQPAVRDPPPRSSWHHSNLEGRKWCEEPRVTERWNTITCKTVIFNLSVQDCVQFRIPYTSMFCTLTFLLFQYSLYTRIPYTSVFSVNTTFSCELNRKIINYTCCSWIKYKLVIFVRFSIS